MVSRVGNTSLANVSAMVRNITELKRAEGSAAKSLNEIEQLKSLLQADALRNPNISWGSQDIGIFSSPSSELQK